MVAGAAGGPVSPPPRGRYWQPTDAPARCSWPVAVVASRARAAGGGARQVATHVRRLTAYISAASACGAAQTPQKCWRMPDRRAAYAPPRSASACVVGAPWRQRGFIPASAGASVGVESPTGHQCGK